MNNSEYEYIQSLLDTIESLTKIVKHQNEVLKMYGIEIFDK